VHYLLNKIIIIIKKYIYIILYFMLHEVDLNMNEYYVLFLHIQIEYLPVLLITYSNYKNYRVDRAFAIASPRLWKSLSVYIRSAQSLNLAFNSL